MSSKREIPESVVIVRNEHGATATIRYKNARLDKIVSTPSQKSTTIYKIIEAQVLGKEYYGKKTKQED